MSHLFFRHLLFIHQSLKKRSTAFTLVELLIVVIIVGTLSAIGVPTYNSYIEKNRQITAVVDIYNTDSQIERFRALSGRPPNDFAEANISAQNDPWGRPYQYLRIQGIDFNTIKHLVRRDKHENPVNYDYDLYSIGKDGKTEQKFWKPDAYDDIVRCNNGAYIGLASEY